MGCLVMHMGGMIRKEKIGEMKENDEKACCIISSAS
jgi:hypothetical protein